MNPRLTTRLSRPTVLIGFAWLLCLPPTAAHAQPQVNQPDFRMAPAQGDSGAPLDIVAPAQTSATRELCPGLGGSAGLREAIAHVRYQPFGAVHGLSRQTSGQQATTTAHGAKKILAAVVGAFGGALVGVIVGTSNAPRCHACDDPGMEQGLMGAWIGGFAGLVLGLTFF